MKNETKLTLMKDMQDEISWLEDEAEDPQTGEDRTEEINQMIPQIIDEIADLEHEIEQSESFYSDDELKGRAQGTKYEDDFVAVAPNLDMDNIANLFFAWHLSETAFLHVRDGDTISKSQNRIIVSNKFGSVDVTSDEHGRVESEYATSGDSTDVLANGYNMIRFAWLLCDIKNHWFSSPSFQVTVNMNRDYRN